MAAVTAGQPKTPPAETTAFYRQVLRTLTESRLPYLVGGAYALACFTDVVRHTKDLDVFVRPEHVDAVLELLTARGWRTELTFPHWLGKARQGDDFCDVIFSSGNGVATVDDLWFAYAIPGEVFGERVQLNPVEEMIWSKAFVLERERYDGADICHLLRERGPVLDWERLLERFGARWRVLLSHLVLFGFVYPGERDRVPAWVMRELLRRVLDELEAPAEPGKVCQGTLLSREQYLKDVQEWGYHDARLKPQGPMSAREVRHWTRAIDERT